MLHQCCFMTLWLFTQEYRAIYLLPLVLVDQLATHVDAVLVRLKQIAVCLLEGINTASAMSNVMLIMTVVLTFILSNVLMVSCLH